MEPVTMFDRLLSEWTADRPRCRREPLRAVVRVAGRFERITSKRLFGAIVVVAEPAAELSVEFELNTDQMRRQEGYGKHGFLGPVAFGLLDVLLIEMPYDILGARLRVVDLAEHPVDSVPFAYRMAGRDAARRILDAHAHAR